MKAILLTPNFTKGIGFLGIDHFVNPSIGLGVIASILLARGCDVVIKDPFAEQLTLAQMVDFITGFKPDVLGISVMSVNYKSACELAKMVKEANDRIRVIVGGPHFYSNIEKIMSDNKSFDYACIGDGYYVIDKLLKCNFQQSRLPQIDGLVYREGSSIVINSPEVVMDIDELPLPAYRIYPKPLVFYKPAINNRKRLPNTTMVTSRGCPSQCIFCQGAIFNRRVRMHSAEYVIEHLKYVISDFGIKDVLFFDDIFTLNKERLTKICALIEKENIDITWGCFLKPTNAVDEDMLKMIKKSGCWLVMPGVESGSPEILKILRKDISLANVQRICRIADKIGIQARPSFMLANPGETKETLEQTRSFILSLPITHVGLTYFTPLPGTPMWDNIDKYGYFNRDDTDKIFITSPRASFIPKEMSRDELEGRMQEFYFKFYFRPSMVLRHLKYLKDFHELRKLAEGIKIFLRLSLNRIVAVFRKVN